MCASASALCPLSKTKEIVVAIVRVNQCLWHWSRHGGRELILKGFVCSWVRICVVSFEQGQHWVSASLSVKDAGPLEMGTKSQPKPLLGSWSHRADISSPSKSFLSQCHVQSSNMMSHSEFRNYFPQKKCAPTHSTMDLRSHFFMQSLGTELIFISTV